MEKYDLTQTVSNYTVVTQGLVVIALIVLSILFFLWIRHGYTNNKGFVMGVASFFLICGCVLVMIARGELFFIDAVTAADIAEGQKTALLNFMQILFICIECGILIPMLYYAFVKMFYAQGSTTFGNVLMFSFGYAAVDILNTVFRVGTNWMFANTINTTGLKEIVSTLKEEEIDSFMESIDFLFHSTPLEYILAFVERGLFLAFAISIVTMLYLIAKGVKKVNTLALVWGMYVLYYFPSLIKSAGLIKSDAIVILIALVYIIAVFIYVKKQHDTLIPEDKTELRAILDKGVFKVIFNSKTPKKVKSPSGSINKAANMTSKK